MSDVMELMKKHEDLEAMIQAQNERFAALQQKITQVGMSALQRCNRRSHR